MFVNSLLQAGRLILHISDPCRIAFDLNIEIIKSFCLGKKIDIKHAQASFDMVEQLQI